MSDLTGYDLVLASTESALNSSIEYANFWKVTINYQLNPDVAADASPGLVGAKISAPALRLSGSDLASNQAAVTLQFTVGTLQYVDVVTGKILSQNIAGWTIVFAANIGQGSIPGNADISQLPAEVQEALSNALLSVGQLFLELSTVVWANVTITDSGGSPVTDSIITATLEDSLQGWAQSVESAAQQWVLNYVITSSNGSGGTSGNVLTDLVPTSYNFSVSKYNPPGEYDDLSTLNYLMMTDGKSAPTTNTAGIFDFNWVAGPNTQEYQAAIAIDGSLFNSAYVESQLLPAIASAIGAPGATFTSSEPGTWTLVKTADLYGSQNDGKGKKLEGLGVQRVYQNIIEELDCTVSLDAANATYAVNGTYKATTIITVEFVGWSATDSSFNDYYALPWSFNIQLKASADGTLVAESTAVQEGESSTQTSGNSIPGDIWALISDIFSSFLNTYSAQFQKAASSISESDFSNISDQLATTMGDISNSIVFPAGNRFAYKGVSFDSDQNLVAYVTYIS